MDYNDIFTADVFLNFYLNLTIGEAAYKGFSHWDIELFGNSLCQNRICVACK